MPVRCPKCREMLPKEAFIDPRGSRCRLCADCRIAETARNEAKLKAQRAEKDEDTLTPEGVEVRKCGICGTEIPQVNHRLKKYCSPACRKEANKRMAAKSKKEKPKKKRKLSPRTCIECGKDFQPANPNQRTCSKPCRDKRTWNHTKHSKKGPNTLENCPYEAGVKWAGVEINSTNFNPMG